MIAQFFPRLAVYNDVEGWQNYQFWGNGEFALKFLEIMRLILPFQKIISWKQREPYKTQKRFCQKAEFQRYKKSFKHL